MTVQQFHREFKIALDKVDSESYPEFLPGEIDYYLNEAQDRFIKQRYGLNNIYKAGYEEIQKRTDDLKELVKTTYVEILPVDYYISANNNVFRANLQNLFLDYQLTNPSSDEYMLFVKATTQTCVNNCCNWSKVKLVQQDDLSGLMEDPFNRPTLSKPIIFFEDGDIFIWTEKTATINGFLVTFIKMPNQINIGTYGGPVIECELSDHTHREILQMAVSIALENIESPRQQSQEILNVQKVE